MNHLAIAVLDVAASQAFYCAYFGFRVGRGPGFLEGPNGFVLSMEPVSAPLPIPEWLHHGFHLSTEAELHSLYARMKADGVPIADDLKRQGPTLVFFCCDPAGFLVEVRAPTGADTP